MANTSNLPSRIQAWLIAKSFTTSPVRFAAYEGGDYIFITPTGAEIRVDLVLGRASHG